MQTSSALVLAAGMSTNEPEVADGWPRAKHYRKKPKQGTVPTAESVKSEDRFKPKEKTSGWRPVVSARFAAESVMLWRRRSSYR
ncbi:hypothetical protein AXG93_3556s1150 [Marchantia polymorpha subsp. ruderalis]|uniref:Uncharacterized protein n=1 Tax=Marchantia polymorpha subsp. ruderalis TaxID=1480154 RepID=A0A176WK89_MARPO|nr:hypothetical protein AXG93_3556s1150 [Marchantia polymorpha subsp. ruderalis]